VLPVENSPGILLILEVLDRHSSTDQCAAVYSIAVIPAFLRPLELIQFTLTGIDFIRLSLEQKNLCNMVL